MNQQALLLFSDGSGHDDSWIGSNFVTFPFHTLRSIKSKDANSLELYFYDKEVLGSPAVITLSIENGKHIEVTNAIFKSVLDSTTAVTIIADVGNWVFAHKYIYDVSIKSQETFIQTLTGNSRTKLNVLRGNYKSCMVANIDGSDAVDLTLELYDGTTYTKLLSTVSIPADTTLKLENDEISFDDFTYDLYATSGDSGGQLTFTFNY